MNRVCLDSEARELWHGVYPQLSDGKPGLLGAMTSRAEAQTVRLATVYALLDGAPRIGREHLEAALALEAYSERSVQYLFGGKLGDPLADELESAIRLAPNGLTRTEIRDHFKRLRLFSESEIAALANKTLVLPSEDDYRWTEDEELGWVFGGDYPCYSIRNREHSDGSEGLFPFSEWSSVVAQL